MLIFSCNLVPRTPATFFNGFLRSRDRPDADLTDIPSQPRFSLSSPALYRSTCQLNDGEKQTPSDLATITGWVVQQ